MTQEPLTQEAPAKKIDAIPKYRSTQVVGALQIERIESKPDGKLLLHSRDGYPPVALPDNFAARHDPQPGGFVVNHADGKLTYCPKDEFEEGYKRI